MTKKKQSILQRLLPYSQNKKPLLFLALICSACSAILLLLPMLYIHAIIKELVLTGTLDYNSLKTNVFYATIFPILGLLTYMLGAIFSHIFAFEVEQNIIKEAMDKLLHMPISYFLDKESGKIRNLIMNGASETHSILAHQLPDLASSIIAPIIILIFLFVFDWRLGLCCLVPIFVGLTFMSTLMTEQGKKNRDEYYDNLNNLSAEAVEYVRGIPIVKTFGQSVLNFRQLHQSIMAMKKSVLKMALGWRNKMALYEAVMESVAFFLIPLAIILIGNGSNSKNIIINTVIYLLIGPIFGIFIMRNATISQYLFFARQGLDRIDKLLDYPAQTYGNIAKLEEGPLEFRNVSFAYNDEQILNNVSFKINKGETIALVGPSGGGKSTIAKLAASFFKPQRGSILLNGYNINDYSQEALMANLTFVFQNAKLFKKSIEENILLGKKDADASQLNIALEKAGASSIIKNLKDGLKTIYGSKGSYLSGGEEQRLILARAFLKDSSYLILDEATAFADPENEKEIINALHKLAKNKTTLLIAHRLSSVTGVNKILVIDKGEIKEEGSHLELLAKEGIYAKMWKDYQTSIKWQIGGQND